MPLVQGCLERGGTEVPVRRIDVHQHRGEPIPNGGLGSGREGEGGQQRVAGALRGAALHGRGRDDQPERRVRHRDRHRARRLPPDAGAASASKGHRWRTNARRAMRRGSARRPGPAGRRVAEKERQGASHRHGTRVRWVTSWSARKDGSRPPFVAEARARCGKAQGPTPAPAYGEQPRGVPDVQGPGV